MISTRSPTRYSFFSSCTLYFARRVMYLPYLACAKRRSTTTTRVLFILSPTTTPTRTRFRFLGRPPFSVLAAFAGVWFSLATAYFSLAAATAA